MNKGILTDNIRVIRSADIGQRLKVGSSAAIGGNLKVSGWLDAPNLRGMCVGLFADEDALLSVWPRPRDGMYALIGDTVPADVWRASKGVWAATGETGGDSTIDFSDYDELKVLVNNLVMGDVKRISVDDFNAFPADTDAVKSAWLWPSRWQITLSSTSSHVIGICDVFFDGQSHTIVEILTTQHSISDEELQASSHVDGLVCTYMRVYKCSSSGTLTNDDETWTEWKLVNMVNLASDDEDDDDDDDSTTTTVDNAMLLTVINQYATLTAAIEANSESITALTTTVDGLAVLTTDEVTEICTFDDDEDDEE